MALLVVNGRYLVSFPNNLSHGFFLPVSKVKHFDRLVLNFFIIGLTLTIYGLRPPGSVVPYLTLTVSLPVPYRFLLLVLMDFSRWVPILFVVLFSVVEPEPEPEPEP